ncbi:MAG: rhodanese-like domain-containing protein, partial [Thiomonas sp.]
RFYPAGGAALLALTFGDAKGAALSLDQWNKLKAEYPDRYRLLQESGMSVPGMGVAVSSKVDAGTVERLRAALLNPGSELSTALAAARLTDLQPANAAMYQQVAQLGYFTPKRLDGVRLVNFAQVQQLMKQGVPLIDDRAEAEYLEGHIAGALSIPYQERSDKTVDFDPKQDSFDLLRRFPDKSKPFIIACNGPECWKSYKGAVFARRHGYKTIYWYREGYPDWVKHGGPVRKGAQP